MNRRFLSLCLLTSSSSFCMQPARLMQQPDPRAIVLDMHLVAHLAGVAQGYIAEAAQHLALQPVVDAAQEVLEQRNEHKGSQALTEYVEQQVYTKKSRSAKQEKRAKPQLSKRRHGFGRQHNGAFNRSLKKP